MYFSQHMNSGKCLVQNILSIMQQIQSFKQVSPFIGRIAHMLYT
jgi:hypothetical protein